MFGQTWNNNTIRKYVIYFGTLFNQVYLQRDNDAREVVQTMKVPLNYGPKEKFLARLEGNTDLNRHVAIQLPRMAFEIINIAYDATRKTAAISTTTAPDPDDPNKARYQYAPVPYDLEFSLYIMVKNQEDGTRIVEQILPFFTPSFTATLNLNPQLGIKHDIPLILDSVSQEDTYEGDFETRRAIIWTLNFTMKAYMFGPVRTRNIIKDIDLNFRPPSSGTDLYTVDPTAALNLDDTNVHVAPGLSNTGDPVNWFGKSDSSFRPTNSIDSSLIASTDNYGYLIDFSGDP